MNLKKNLIINWIFFFWLILIFLWYFIFNKLFFNWKIYKNISQNIDYFVEFNFKDYEKFWSDFEKILWKNQAFFTSYIDDINKNFNFKKWAIIFYKWKRIDAILTWSENKSKKFLETISIWEKRIVEKKNNFLISENSPAPFCQQNWENLFCSKDKIILKNFISDIKNWKILRKDPKFLKVENNILIQNNFIFLYLNFKNQKNFPLISNNFISWWFSFWVEKKLEKNWEKNQIKWMFYWYSKKNIKNNLPKTFKTKKIFLSENTIFLADIKNFNQKLENYFDFYSEKNQKIWDLAKRIFKEKKEKYKNILEQKNIFFDKEENLKSNNLFIFKEKKDKYNLLKNQKSENQKSENIESENRESNKKNINLKNFLPKSPYSDEKIFINLKKINENFWIKFLSNFKSFWAVSKTFDDWIQIKFLIK